MMRAVFLLGLLLLALDEILFQRSAAGTRVEIRYIPRDLDAWFKDPANQPTAMFTSTLFGDNVRTM